MPSPNLPCFAVDIVFGLPSSKDDPVELIPVAKVFGFSLDAARRPFARLVGECELVSDDLESYCKP